MDVSLLLKIIFFISLLTQSNSHAEVYTCGLDSPEIRHPFQIQGRHRPRHGGAALGFELSCEREKTIINFPDYRDMEVKSILYDTKRLDLSDPKNCVHEVFLNLNLSQTPFRYYHVLKQYKYINCSTEIPSPLLQFVPCMSSDSTRSYVYTVELSFVVPVYCEIVKSVGIPFAYSPYLSDSSFGLELTWDSTEKIEAWRFQTTLKASAKMMALILMVGIVLYAKIPQRCTELSQKKTRYYKYGEVAGDVISLGEYEALNIAQNVNDDTDLV